MDREPLYVVPSQSSKAPGITPNIVPGQQSMGATAVPNHQVRADVFGYGYAPNNPNVKNEPPKSLEQSRQDARHRQELERLRLEEQKAYRLQNQQQREQELRRIRDEREQLRRERQRLGQEREFDPQKRRRELERPRDIAKEIEFE